MYPTFKDPDANGYVQAKLYKRNVETGAVSSVATVTPALTALGSRQVSAPVSGFDFDNYAYFVRIAMNQTNTTSDQEFHIVRLASCLFLRPRTWYLPTIDAVQEKYGALASIEASSHHRIQFGRHTAFLEGVTEERI